MVMLRHVPRRAKGYISVVGPAGMIDEGETLQCVHCQMHWIVRPGSKTTRGWCFKCNGPTCGKHQCMDRCVPFEKVLEKVERRAKLFKDIDRCLAGNIR